MLPSYRCGYLASVWYNLQFSVLTPCAKLLLPWVPVKEGVPMRQESNPCTPPPQSKAWVSQGTMPFFFARDMQPRLHWFDLFCACAVTLVPKHSLIPPPPHTSKLCLLETLSCSCIPIPQLTLQLESKASWGVYVGDLIPQLVQDNGSSHLCTSSSGSASLNRIEEAFSTLVASSRPSNTGINHSQLKELKWMPLCR